MSDQKVTIPAEQLKDILSSVIAEARKPVRTEEELKAAQEKLEERRFTAQQMIEVEKNRERTQALCTHCHWENNRPRTVYVENGNFMICQACQKIIRPETEFELFNRLMQAMAPSIY